MMNDTTKMRVELKTLYGEKWRKRVDKMSDAQVVAIFKKMVHNGQIKL